MSGLKGFLDRILLLDLFAGLRITGRHFFRRKVTVQYPEERCEPADRFRGMFRLDEERCIKCTLCARDCPIDILYIDFHQEVNAATGKKEKVLDRFDIDIQRCMFCGLCEEACPTEPKSIWLTTKTYELASYDRWRNLYVDKQELQGWRGRPAYTDEEVA
jgi:NADH-quinone oxidoreductase subunit I